MTGYSRVGAGDRRGFTGGAGLEARAVFRIGGISVFRVSMSAVSEGHPPPVIAGRCSSPEDRLMECQYDHEKYAGNVKEDKDDQSYPRKNSHSVYPGMMVNRESEW